MTGLHSVHMLAGIGVVAVLAVMTARRRFTPDYFTPVELGGLYWHLVDIVWIFLYPLLYLVSRT
jgi:cytochrome c oxidase subunit III